MGALTAAAGSGLGDAAADRITVDDIAAALGELLAVRSARGQEGPLADRLSRWCRSRWPEVDWRYEQLAGAAGQLVARGPARSPGPDRLLLYSHLDTSLVGVAVRDAPLSGLDDPVPAPVVDVPAGVARGFGLGVAKGPAAAALTAYAVTSQLLLEHGHRAACDLLLAAGGTHRSPYDDAAGWGPPSPSGVRAYLADHGVPGAAIVAKGGPAGVLTDEPGAAFLRVRWETAMMPVLAQGAARPPGGVLVHLGPALTAVAIWCEQHRSREGVGQMAAEAGLGAIRGGVPGKPDLLPGRVELQVYAVILPGDELDDLVASLRATIATAVAGTPLDALPLTVEGALEHTAASTPAGAPIATRARAAWSAEHGCPAPPITGWTGSTDGVVLRGAGAPTARLGPRARSTGDPRVDEVELAELVRFARIYARIIAAHASATDTNL